MVLRCKDHFFIHRLDLSYCCPQWNIHGRSRCDWNLGCCIRRVWNCDSRGSSRQLNYSICQGRHWITFWNDTFQGNCMVEIMICDRNSLMFLFDIMKFYLSFGLVSTPLSSLPVLPAHLLLPTKRYGILKNRSYKCHRKRSTLCGISLHFERSQKWPRLRYA